MTLYLAILQLALPLAMIIWLSAGRPTSRTDFVARIAAAWILLFGIAVAGLWLALPVATVAVLAALTLLASTAAGMRFRAAGVPSGKAALWSGHIALLAAVAFGLWAAVPAVAGWREPAGTVDLAFPFREGRYLVVNGGAAERINGHFMTLKPEFQRWRGESYAVDLIGIDAVGFRTRERHLFAMPRNPSAYLTYGARVHAPCSGVVDAAVSNRPDMPVPQRDRANLAGNFVLLRCNGNMVMLGHFRRNAVHVKAGDPIRVGQLLGAVGNSGNTDEPHLHIHVQRPGPANAPLAGDPLYLTFDGRFPLRNMIFETAG